MFFMKCICSFVSITAIIYAIQPNGPNDVQNVYPKRIKRLINFKDTKEISIEEHDRLYPFIVGIKTVQKKLTKKIRVRCTGTMLNPHLVLTTGLCVINPSLIMVFKHDNPFEREMNEKGVRVEIRHNVSRSFNSSDLTGKRRLPNPLFYGNMIDRNHEWSNFDPMEESGKFPLKNIAILYLEEPLHSYETTINYPVIEMDPGEFTRKNVAADMFGWCQYEHGTTPKNEPRLTKTTIQVTSCGDKNNFALCVDKAYNDGSFCDLDQGGPVIVSGAGEKTRRRRREERSPPRLVALINRAAASGGPYHGRLLYVWPYAEWVTSVVEEYAATPTPVPTCSTPAYASNASSTDSAARWVHIESYYDFAGRGETHARSVNSPCATDAVAAPPTPPPTPALVLAAAAVASLSPGRRRRV